MKLKVSLTPEAYESLKRAYVDGAPPQVRFALNFAVELLAKCDPVALAEAIERGTSIKELYDSLPKASYAKVAAAAAKSFLRLRPDMAARLREHLTPSFVKFVMRYENPVAFEVVEMYGGKGDEWLAKAIGDVLEIVAAK